MKKTGFGSALGTAGAALLASSCCWLPLLLIAMGAGAAAVGSVTSVFETYRPAFVGIAVALLGTAIYFVYFRRPRIEPACCRTDSISRAGRVNKFLLPIVGVFVLGAALFPERVFGFLTPKEHRTVAVPSGSETVVLEVPGMT